MSESTVGVAGAMEAAEGVAAESVELGREERRSGDSPLAMRVYEGIRAQIVSGELRPDQKLLGEHQLAAVFQVSRPIVRDALQRLRDEGLIYSRRGAGSFVKVRPGQAAASATVGFAPVETIADIQRCYEFRLSIEPEHAYWAANRRDQKALDAMAAAVDLMRDATAAHQHREDADFAFHCAIAEATNNHYFVSSMLALRDHIHVGMKVHGSALLGPRRGLEGVFEEHVRIFEAIRDRHAERARETMRRHVEGSRDRVFEGRTLDLSL
jgi:GntR family transcriptional regulator, transcriptional repressor for pyruvate dehydrogenase complex